MNGLTQLRWGCALLSLLLLGACGSDTPGVCQTAASALIENCDPSNRDDVSDVSTSLRNACGIDFDASALDSRASLESLCVEALADADISEDDAASFQAVLDDKVGCMSVANNIGLACRDFL